MLAHLSNWIAQTGSVTRLSLETIIERKGACAASVFGIAGVVAVFIAVLSIAQGFRQVMTRSGDPAKAIVLRSGSDSEMMSFFSGPEARLISDAPGIAHTPDGPLASRELFVVINLPKRSTGTDANVPLRGVSPHAFAVHHQLRILQGRRFIPGLNEVIVGVGAAGEFAGLDLGATMRVGRSDWSIVGLFTADGGLAESEIWTDATVLQDAYQRGNSYQSVVVKLTSPAAFPTFQRNLENDPRLRAKALLQTDYYLEQSRTVYNLITGPRHPHRLADGRRRRLRRPQYHVHRRRRPHPRNRHPPRPRLRRSPVVVSILIESLLLALLGGAIGGGLAYWIFDGFRAATMNWQSFSQVAFAFRVTPGLLIQGILCATIIGLIGGLFPALRAARLPIARALREL
jgi:putative ABC transport system permease protein